MIKRGSTLLNSYSIGIQTLLVTAFISFKQLLSSNMGRSNEVDVLPLAKQFVDPAWIPGDWYLNQPAGYRLLFNLLAGKLITLWGFLAASIIGRLLCYALVALSLVLIGQKLKLRFPLLLLAIGLFLYGNKVQGVAAAESILRGLEAKAPAYGCVLMAIWLLLERRYRWMALMLGFATSFHVLVGGWTFLTVMGWLLLKRALSLKQIQQVGVMLLIYTVASSLAVKPVFDQLFAPLPSSPITPSFIYVFLRLPHHLNPLSWSPTWWMMPAAYLLGLTAIMAVLGQQQNIEKQAERFEASRDLFGLTLVSLIPFAFGLVVASFDIQGHLLQLYPFRLGAVLLPLVTCLLAATALEQFFSSSQQQKILGWVCVSLIVGICGTQAPAFEWQLAKLHRFPPVESEIKALCEWIRIQTPVNVTIVSPPVELVAFTWLSERPTIAKYKLLPQTKTEIIHWYERLSDLSGGTFPLPDNVRLEDEEDWIEQRLTENYQRLDSAQAIALMHKYQASYFVTEVEHQLELPLIYRNTRYVLYSLPVSNSIRLSQPLSKNSNVELA